MSTVAYTSDSQPGVRLPLGVLGEVTGGTWESFTLSILSDIDQYGHVCAPSFHLFTGYHCLVRPL